MTAEYFPTASHHQVDTYAHRAELNRASRAWASRDGETWTEDEDLFLLEFWIDVEPAGRDEVTVSQALERTIEACRVRCEHVRKRLGISRVTITVTTVTTTEVCGSCWEVLPVSGVCGNH